MRKSYISILAMALCVFAACEKQTEVENIENTDVTENNEGGTYTYTVKASASDVTKTDYDASGNFSWSAGDAISVLFHNGDENRFYTLTTATGNGVFSGEIDNGYTIGASDGSESDLKIWALFPASASHSYTAGENPSFYVQPEVDFTTSHFSANIPMYALNTVEGDLAFTNLASTYKFTLNGIKDGVSKVEFTVYNQTTYGLSGSWPIHNEKYVNYGYAAPGSEKSTLKYIGSVINNKAVFYVSCRYWGTFKPNITIKNCATDRIIKTFTAGQALTPTSKSTVKPVTLDVSEANGGDYYVPAIDIDGDFDDWDDVSHTITTSDSNIVEWKYTKDAKNLYLYYKVPKNKVVKAEGNYNWDPYMFIGIDTDNNTTTGGTTAVSGFGGGNEVEILVYPWRGTAPADPECVIGEEANGHIKVYNTTSSAFDTLSEEMNIGGKIEGNYCYLEARIPLASIKYTSGSMRINHSFGYSAIGATQIMPEVATLSVSSATDVTLGVGKTSTISATTNSTAAICYASGNDAVATVDANGVITGVAAGSTTITVSVAAITGEYTAASTTVNVYVPAIEIDGDLSDWSAISALPSSGTSRIREWKFVSDSQFVYFYFSLRKNRVGTGKNLVIGFNTDNDSGTGSNYDTNKILGNEATVTVVPFTNTVGSDPIPVEGYDPSSSIEIYGGGKSTGDVYVWDYDAGELLSSDSSSIYIELSIPKNKLNLPAAGNTITIGCAFDYYVTGTQSITL